MTQRQASNSSSSRRFGECLAKETSINKLWKSQRQPFIGCEFKLTTVGNGIFCGYLNAQVVLWNSTDVKQWTRFFWDEMLLAPWSSNVSVTSILKFYNAIRLNREYNQETALVWILRFPLQPHSYTAHRVQPDLLVQHIIIIKDYKSQGKYSATLSHRMVKRSQL